VAIAAANFKAGRQSRSFQDQLSNMRMPIQIIWGSADRIIDPAQARALPTSVEIHILADAAHMAHMEQPAEVNRLISNFISIRF
jgi:pyruvate dehydrogenase E2 component (dihydrolipoamide acetyltransferase)